MEQRFAGERTGVRHRIWSQLLGAEAEWIRRGLADGSVDSRRRWQEQKRVNGRRYGLLVVCLAITSVGLSLPTDGPQKMDAVLKVGSIVEKSGQSVSVAAASGEGQTTAADSWRLRLEEELHKRNPSFPSVAEDLQLPQRLESGGAPIRWISGDPKLLRSDGTVDWLRVGGGAETYLLAMTKLGDAEVSHRLSVQLLPPAEPILRARMGQELDAIIARADREPGQLPRETEQGWPVEWVPADQGRNILVLALFPVLFAVVYKARFGRLEEEAEATRKRIAMELPEMVERLSLLLYAGCVTESAFRRLAAAAPALEQGGGRGQAKNVGSPLYRSLEDICLQVERSRTPLGAVLADTAGRSGVREWARIASIVADSMDKGNALAEKLEGEAALLRTARSYQREADSRTAETKLVLPMLLLLASLLLITTGPVLLTM